MSAGHALVVGRVRHRAAALRELETERVGLGHAIRSCGVDKAENAAVARLKMIMDMMERVRVKRGDERTLSQKSQLCSVKLGEAEDHGSKLERN